MTGPYVPACVACWATGTPCGDPRHDTDVIPERARFRDGRCPCQDGSCGHCRSGRHHDCTTTRHGPTEHPATYLIDTTGAAIAPVHEARTTHAWVCDCHRAGHPTSNPQGDLLALIPHD